MRMRPGRSVTLPTASATRVPIWLDTMYRRSPCSNCGSSQIPCRSCRAGQKPSESRRRILISSQYYVKHRGMLMTSRELLPYIVKGRSTQSIND
ncbi:hypothetical protein BDV39DRAFT_178767 [Aspergillus sergii]|uniref:Uncharacterized protein n=1 Tax=Aspergillus sergii TaxID=1034303 RepID=A0A5N6WXG4_9EURO|nr:hypothetical protein BDV39DRAFT_178767 [Aspergillus sergii]